MLDPNGDYILLDSNQERLFTFGENINTNSNFHKLRSLITAAAMRILRIKTPGFLRSLHQLIIASTTRLSTAVVFAISCAIFILILLSYHFLLNDFSNSNNKIMMTETQNILSIGAQKHFFQKRIVHLDLKGAAPKPEYLFELFALFAKIGINAVLMEYEDMFPYSGKLSQIARKTAYNISIIEQIVKNARLNGLELIPLVQTFGHMEFVLKHENFSSLRENPVWVDTICPSNERSIWLIKQILTQIRNVHSDAKSIHIGCDEAWHVGENELCLHKLNATLKGSKDRLKLEHISRIARIARDEYGFQQVYAWNDMFNKIKAPLLVEYELDKLLIPVIWGYAPDVTKPGYFPTGLLQRLSQVFNDLLFASAFKGANGISQQFADIERYMENLASYRQLYRDNITFLEGRLSGIILTGWQRYAHSKPLCELLPVGIPALIKQALYIQDWNRHSPRDINQLLMDFLMCPKHSAYIEQEMTYQGHKFPSSMDIKMSNCKFPGVDLYKEIEQIRFLKWKLWLTGQLGLKELANNNSNKQHDEQEAVELEYQECRRRISILLTKYFFEDTVQEWMVQHSRLTDF